jgi:meso-butanediol dehydrogenase / (S,S)-butanediol dehydrogenase / diacetyl reductase
VSDHDQRLLGKVAVITGGASGIGRAAAERFLVAGASVAVVDLDEAGLRWAANVPNALPIVSDVADSESQADVVERTSAAFGPIDIAFLNAGVNDYGSILRPSLEGFQRTIGVNLLGPIHGLRAVLPQMVAKESGSVIVTSSLSGLLGTSGLWAYNATKAALLNLVRSVAAEMGPHGVRVNAICPGPIVTGFVPESAEERAPVETWIPLRRWGSADEVARAVLFLASDESSYITGSALAVDGGMSAVSYQPNVVIEDNINDR